MDAQLVALATAGGTTLVTLMATDAWQRAKSGVGALWRKVRPEKADVIEAELVDVRAELTSGDEPDQALVAELTAEWQGRLRRLLAAEPAAADELRRLVTEWRDEAATTGITAGVGGLAVGGNSRVDINASGEGSAAAWSMGAVTINPPASPSQ